MRIKGLFTALTKASTPLFSEITQIQTDGSFRQNISRTAVILTKPKGEVYTLSKTYFTHKNSHESEWCSVLDGIEYSIKKEAQAIDLENDNQGVINSLTSRRPPKSPYADYFYYIMDLTKEFEYVGVRWIPRAQNKADNLFRI